jgi:hypothetical protein
MCNLNYNPTDLHQHLVHEFYHGLAKTIIPMFFVIFGLPKIQTMASRIHILALDSPTTTNEAQWKIEQLYELFLLPSHVPIGHQQPFG